MVYGQIINFPKYVLSRIGSIFLIGCINSKDLLSKEFSNDRVICPILNEIKNLNESNFDFKIKIEFFAGDTPAAQSLGGFIEAVGNANYPCRHCEIKKIDICKVYSEDRCFLRNLENVIDRSQNLGNLNNKGIKRTTEIFRFKDIFDPIKQTPQDPMHVILEGVARVVVMYYLKVWTKIRPQRTTIDEINARIMNFNYGFLKEKGRMKPLNENDLKKDILTITGSQMKTLLIVFPFMFMDIVDLESDDYR